MISIFLYRSLAFVCDISLIKYISSSIELLFIEFERVRDREREKKPTRIQTIIRINLTYKYLLSKLVRINIENIFNNMHINILIFIKLMQASTNWVIYYGKECGAYFEIESFLVFFMSASIRFFFRKL